MEKLLIVLGGCVGAVAVIAIFKYLKSKGINVGAIIKDTEAGLKDAEEYTEAAVNLATGKTKAGLTLIETIEKFAITACGYAEQLYVSQQITDDVDGSKRKASALTWIYTALGKIGIDVDDNVKTIATGIVENTVFNNKTIQEIKAQVGQLIQDKVESIKGTNDNLQEQVTKLTTENTQLNTDKDVLQQKINAIKAATETTQK